jgi:hypothetical protein
MLLINILEFLIENRHVGFCGRHFYGYKSLFPLLIIKMICNMLTYPVVYDNILLSILIIINITCALVVILFMLLMYLYGEVPIWVSS